MSVLLGLVNPFLEEFFWRSFVPISFMGGIMDKSFSVQTEEKLILMVNFFYTIYHFPVVLYFVKYIIELCISDTYPAFVVIVILFFGGRLFFLL